VDVKRNFASIHLTVALRVNWNAIPLGFYGKVISIRDIELNLGITDD
jgi:hypothetical protein